jgi:hypothetical protein
MIWLTWRQFRAQSIGAAAALAVFAVILAVTGPDLAHQYAISGLATCRDPGDCGARTSSFLSQMRSGSVYPALYFLGAAVVYLAPALIGAFWGAPLVSRELEAGTWRLAWNQSVTRTRWMAVKLTLIGLAAMATAGLLSLMITWWAAPIDRVGGFPTTLSQLSRFSPQMFGARGIAPFGYAAFAFALGVTAGVLIRRTVAAMAVTLAVFAAVQVIMPNVVRPDLIPPAQVTMPIHATLRDMIVTHNGQITVPAAKPGVWVISNQTITPDGHVFVLPVTPACQSGTEQACDAWLAGRHLRQRITYQPASRYWAFQWYETAIFLALAVMLAGLCVWRIRRQGD